MNESVTVINSPRYQLVRAVWYITSFVQLLLLVRLILRLIGASAAPFTTFIYNITEPLMRPFAHMVRAWDFGSGILDWNIVIALFVYWIIAQLIVSLINLSQPHRQVIVE